MGTIASETTAPYLGQTVGPVQRPIHIALLGLGRIGGAVAGRLHASTGSPLARVIVALVRDPARRRDVPLPPDAVVTSDADAVFARRPDVVVELLGGVDPAFALVARALALGIPVVTANKSLLAARGQELDALAARHGAPLLYEASVLAGVPFLGALARRPCAASVTRIEGILNGTSNFILTRMGAGVPFADALADAQRLGLAEARPDNDVLGVDAAEKLAVLVRHLRWGSIRPDRIETAGIPALGPHIIGAARESGGVIKPLALAVRANADVAAFSGPAFVPHGHRLSCVGGADNVLALSGPYGTLVYGGPGAGPDATAATVLDDVVEAAAGVRGNRAHAHVAAGVGEVETGWLVRLTAARGLPPGDEIADFLGSHGIWIRHTSRQAAASVLLTYQAPAARLDAALAALGAAAACDSVAVRALEA